MNEHQRILHHLLGLREDEEPTCRQILLVESCDVSDAQIDQAVETRASLIMRSLPGPQFVPLMIPVRQILQLAGEELRQQRQQVAQAKKPPPSAAAAPAGAPPTTPKAKKPSPAKPKRPKHRKKGSVFFAAGPETSASQLLSRYNEDLVDFLTADEKRRVLQIPRLAVGRTRATSAAAMEAFWKERKAAGRRGWQPSARPQASPPPTPTPDELAAIAKRMGCSTQMLAAQYASWNRQVASAAPQVPQPQSSEPGPLVPFGAGGGSAPPVRNRALMIWRIVSGVTLIGVVAVIVVVLMNRGGQSDGRDAVAHVQVTSVTSFPVVPPEKTTSGPTTGPRVVGPVKDPDPPPWCSHPRPRRPRLSLTRRPALFAPSRRNRHRYRHSRTWSRRSPGRRTQDTR